MAYTDVINNSRFQIPLIPALVGVGTSTGAGTATNTLVAAINPIQRRFIRPVQVNAIKVYVGTAPVAGATGVTMAFMNGTSTFATAVVGTNTATSWVDATVTSSLSKLFTVGTDGTATNVNPTINMIGTATASGLAFGTYLIDVEVSEPFYQ